MEGSKKSVILKTVGICAVVAVVGTAAVLVPVLVANKKNQEENKNVLVYGDVQVSTGGSTATLNGPDGKTIKNGDNDAMFITTDGGVFGSNLAAGTQYTVTNPNFTPKKGTSSYFMRAKIVYYGVKDGALTEVDANDYFEVKPTFSTSWLESRDGYFYNVKAGETWAAADNVTKLNVNTATEGDGQGVYLFNENPTYTVAAGVQVEYDMLAVEVKIDAVDSANQTDASLNELGWIFKNPLVTGLRLIFDTNDGTAVDTQEFKEEDVVTLANYTSTKTGYNFLGWSLTNGGDAVASVTFDKEDITVYAKWVEKDLTLTYNLDGGQGSIADTHVYHIGDEATLSSVVPTKAGYAFGGWLVGGEPATAVTFAGENIEVTAKWNAVDYTLTYDLDEGEGDIADTGVHHIGDQVTLTNVVPTKAGYTFAGWTLDGNTLVTSVTFGADNITVRAKWILNLTLALELGDDFIELETVYHPGDTVDLSTLDTPTREGYTFDYWTLNGEEVTSVTFEEEGIIVTAAWIKQLKVIYGLNGGTGNIVDTEVYYVGDTFELTDLEPTREGFRFAGWSLDGENELPEEYDFTFTTEANIILNALWEYWPTSGVRIHALEDYIEEDYQFVDGRNEDEENEFQKTVTLPTLEEPVVGYRLRYAVGSADGELLPIGTEGVTAYAEIIDVYPILEKAMKVTFVVDGEEDQYGYGFAGQQITFPEPTGTGTLYWTDENGEVYNGTQIFVNEENQGTEVTYTANWSETSDVTFSLNGQTTTQYDVLNDMFKLPTTQTVNTSISGVVVGWRVNGEGNLYSPGESFELTGDTTFEAVELNIGFTSGTYGSYYGSQADKPAVAIINGQVKLPENFYGINDNYYYFTGWMNNRTNEVGLPGELADYQDGDTFVAQYARRMATINLDGGTVVGIDSSSNMQLQKDIEPYNNNIYFNYSNQADKKIVDGQVCRISGWEVTSDTDEELYVKISSSSLYVRTKNGNSFTSNQITLKALWAPVGTYNVEFEVEEGVEIIDKATGLPVNLSYTVKEKDPNDENNSYNLYEQLMFLNQLEARGKDGYLPLYSLYTKTGNVIEDDPRVFFELSDHFLGVPGGVVVKVNWEKAYDIEVRKGRIQVEDPETGDMIDVPIHGEITHLKYGEQNNLQNSVMTAGIPYTAEGWMIDFSQQPELYSVATGEPWHGDLEDIYMVPKWVNIGIDAGSAVINGREIKGRFTQQPYAMVQEGTLLIGNMNPLFGEGALVLNAEIPGHPKYKPVGYELDGVVYNMTNPYSGYYVLSGTKEDGVRFTFAEAMNGRSYTLETYAEGQLVDKQTKSDVDSGGGLWIEDSNGNVSYNNNIGYFYSYQDDYNNRDKNVQVAVDYNENKYYLVEKTGDFAQKPDTNQSIGRSTEEIDYQTWYVWNVAGGKVYSQDGYPGYGQTLYFLADGENFADKIYLNTDNINIDNNSYYVYTNSNTGEVVGYGWSNNSEAFFTATTDSTTPIYRLVGDGASRDDATMDCYGKTFTVVYEKSYDIADGEGYTDGVEEDQEQYDALVERANTAIGSSLRPNPYADFANTTVTADMLGGEVSYADFLEMSEVSMMITQDIDAIMAMMVDGDFRGLPVKAKYDEEDNALVFEKMAYGIFGYRIVYLLDENDHVYKVIMTMAEGMDMTFTFEFAGTVYTEPQEMATTVTFGEEAFGEGMWEVEKSLYEIAYGTYVEPLGEVTQENQEDLLGQRVALNGDVEFTSLPGMGDLKGVLKVTDVDLDEGLATVTCVENDFTWTTLLTAQDLGVEEITASLVGTVINLPESKEFEANLTLDGTVTGIKVNSIDTGTGKIELRYEYQYGVNEWETYDFRAVVELADLDGVESLDDLNNDDDVTLAGSIDFTTTGDFDGTQGDAPTPQVLSVDAQTGIIRIGGNFYGLDFFADVTLADLEGVESLEDLEIGQDVLLAHNVYITGMFTVKANGYVKYYAEMMGGRYAYIFEHFTPEIIAVDPQNQTVTLEVSHGQFTATVSLDAIKGIYKQMTEEQIDSITAIASMTEENGGMEMTNVMAATAEEAINQFGEMLPSSVVYMFTQGGGMEIEPVGTTGTVSWSEDKSEYKIHLEAYEAQFEVVSVDTENETVAVFQAYGEAPFGYYATVSYANIVDFDKMTEGVEEEAIAEALVGRKVAVRGDVTGKMMFKSYDDWSWYVESVDEENQTMIVRGEGITAEVTLAQLKDIEEITESLVGTSVHTQGMIEIFVESGSESGKIVAVDVENQTATVVTSFEGVGATAVVGLEELDGVEEITESLVGTNVYTNGAKWTFDDTVIPEAKMTIDYTFIVDEEGRTTKLYATFVEPEGQMGQGFSITYPVAEEPEEPVEP